MLISAHGLGGVRDLPLPLPLTVAGAGAALAVSFGVLAWAWREPRYDAAGSTLPPRWLTQTVDAPWFVPLARGLALMAWVYLGWALLAGEDILINPIFGVVFVWLWVGLVPASLLFGPILRSLSPLRSIHAVLCKALKINPTSGLLGYPKRLGYWPAAIALLSFVWFELVAFDTSPTLASLRLWITMWVVLTLLGGLLMGTDFIGHAEPFEVYSTLVARLSPWGREANHLVVRSPLANLTRLTPEPGLVATVAVLLGSTAFDSFRESLPWRNLITTREWAPPLANTAALMGFCLLVGGLFAAACMATRTAGDLQRRQLPSALAHSLVPIIVGYIVAHYLTYFVSVGQETLIYLSDPLSTGANLLGTANYVPNTWLTFHPQAVAVTKVLAVVTGHILGVIAAHDRALTLLPKGHQLKGQLALLLVMVGFTTGGLFLLFAA